MEEMKKQLYQLDDLLNHLTGLSGLICILRNSIQSIEMDGKTEYFEGICFISDSLAETDAQLHELSNNLFDSFRSWKTQTLTLVRKEN